MKRILILGVIAFAILGSSSLAAGDYQRTEEMQTLGTEELRRLLHNVSLTRVEDPGITSSHVALERYFAGGGYLSVGGRARREGTFEIRDGRVCLRLRLTGAPECFCLQRDGEGALWKVDGPDHSPVRVRVLPLE